MADHRGACCLVDEQPTHSSFICFRVCFLIAIGCPDTNTERLFAIVMKDYCSTKCWSGVHLGNKTDDWNSTVLQRIDPKLGGKWPRAVVVLSNQVYQINRAPRGPDPNQSCRVQSASVRSDRTVIFDYIQRAAQAGVRVIIRIYPSPGNFPDWNDPNWPNHRLSSGLPAGTDGYCDPDHSLSKQGRPG